MLLALWPCVYFMMVCWYADLRRVCRSLVRTDCDQPEWPCVGRSLQVNVRGPRLGSTVSRRDRVCNGRSSAFVQMGVGAGSRSVSMSYQNLGCVSVCQCARGKVGLGPGVEHRASGGAGVPGVLCVTGFC